MEAGEEEGYEDDREATSPVVELLEEVTSEEQLLVDRGGDEDGEELEPWESTPGLVTYLSGEDDHPGADADQRTPPHRAFQEIGDGQPG